MNALHRLLAGVLLLLLASCGGDSGDGGAPPGPSAPPATPAPGTPVSATIGATGGSLSFSASGVPSTLTVPAGVLLADTQITVTPVAPQAGEWARIRIDGPTRVVEQPLTWTLQLPATDAPVPGAAGVLVTVLPGMPLPTRIESGSTRLTIAIQQFGDDAARTTAAAAGGARQVHALSTGAPPPEVAAVRALPPAQMFAAMEEAVRAHEREQRFATAFTAGVAITAVQMEIEVRDTTFGAQAAALVGRLGADACARLRSTIAAALLIPAPQDFGTDGVEGVRWRARAVEPIHYWQSVVTRLGVAPCSGVDVPASLAQIEGDFVARGRDQLGGVRDVLTFRKVAGPTAAARSLIDQDRVLGQPALAQQVRAAAVQPLETPLRVTAWDASANGTTHDHYRQVLAIYGLASFWADDLQLVGTSLHVTSFADSIGVTVMDQTTFGRQDTPEASLRTGTMSSRPGGKLRVQGPIEVLKCPAAASETLQIDFAGQTVLTRPSAGDKLLEGTLEFDVDTLLRGAGVDPAQATQHALRVKRVGSTCNAAFGVGDAIVTEITLDFATKLGRTSIAGGAIRGLAGDAQGNVYVLGHNPAAFGFTGPAGPFVAKLDATMKPRWIAPYTRTGRGLVGLGIDAAGNVFIAGNVTGNDIFVARLSAVDGTEIWDRVVGTSVYDSVEAMAVDRDGNTFVGGFTFGGLGGSPADTTRAYDFLLKFDRDGNQLWGRNFGGEGIGGLALDAAGNAYVAGEMPTGTKQLAQFCDNVDFGHMVASYGPDGTLRWRALLDSDFREGGRTIGVTGDGVVLAESVRFEELIVSEMCQGNGTTARLRRLDAATGAGGANDTVVGQGTMAQGPEGHVCAVGRDDRRAPPDFRASGTSFVTCFDRAGIVMWSKTLTNADVQRVAIDGKGVVTVSGFTNNTEEGFYARYRLRDGTP